MQRLGGRADLRAPAIPSMSEKKLLLEGEKAHWLTRIRVLKYLLFEKIGTFATKFLKY